MENKINGKMSAISTTSIADSTDSRVSELMDAGYSRSASKPAVESRSLSCLPSSRNFGNAGALIHGLNPSGDCAVFKDCNILDASLAAKHFYDRNSEYVKNDHVQWEDFVKVQRTSAAMSDSVPSASLSLSSTSGASCKFIKDEKEPSVIMDAPCPRFEPALDTCCDADTKPHLALGEGESGGFSAPRAGLEAQGSPNFLIDLNPPEQLVSPVRADSRCALSAKAGISFDGGTQHALARWQMHTSPAEPQFWSAGVTEDAFPASSYDGIQNQNPSQRNPSPFSAFPGMQPQRLCVICGDEASGCHYGVLTCGSCKVFFKRAVEGHHSYLCAGRNDCIVDKIRRKNCPACRLRKCYQAGMMLGGRKLKRFGALKAFGLAPSLMFQSHLAMSSDSQALTSMACVPGIHEMQLSQQIINILENIEPEIVYSGYDASQPEVPHLLLNSLNRLCEKQLLWIVKWSKSLPGFRNLHINDQMTLIQYSWMNLMVFSLGWRSFQNVTSEYLYFAPDLILSQEQMRRSPIYDLCLAIQFIPQEFANLQVTREEFLCMKAIILLNTVPLEGLKSQAAFEEMRQNYIRELSRAIHMKEKSVVASSQRFYHLTKLMDAMHDIVKKVNLFCLSTFIQADALKVEFPEMMSEVIASQLPKVLAGMVKPLLFHTK
ncbi:progesterone receptor [Kryptolebias marmoratus]|uniref:Progesterone receptor n=1 Tax=Kryptolebias marmoratus TaxID=37003 RepID=A0A3Q2ZPU6_KRYMA|nr:progesterone receptor [Kryptolebias marmoratus]XP_037835362.1 progesterone receptor [Kryptolebias marmoratus]